MQVFKQCTGSVTWNFTDPSQEGKETAPAKPERPFVAKCFTFAIPKENLTMKVIENLLHISGKHVDEETGNFTEFERKYQLPEGVDSTKLKTSMRCGMLIVKEENSPMEIPVVVAGDDDDSNDDNDDIGEYMNTDEHEKK